MREEANYLLVLKVFAIKNVIIVKIYNYEMRMTSNGYRQLITICDPSLRSGEAITYDR